MAKILMVLPYANVGGTERHVLLLSRGLRERGVEVRIALPPGPAVDDFRQVGFGLRVLPDPSLWSFPALLKALREEAGAGLDLIHSHAAMEHVWAAQLAAPGVPRVFTAHGYHLELDYMKAGAMLNRSAQAVISVSEPEGDRLLRYGLDPALNRVVCNGIDLEALEGPPGTLKAELKLPESSVLVGMVNRLDRFKGVELLLRALSGLRARVPHVFVAIAGDGPERERLEALTRQLGLGHAVRWLGRRPDLGNVLRSLDAFVTPTRKEAFGMAALEAMACGVPVVATDLPALRGLVRPDRDGVLVPLEAGAEAWEAALSELLSDAGRRERLAAAGRERARAFGHRRMADETLEVYRSLQGALKASPTP